MKSRDAVPHTLSRRDMLRLGGVALSVGAWPGSLAHAAPSKGAVFALTNDPAGNAVAVFRRAGDGTLTPDATTPTGGSGLAGDLASQGALALSRDRRYLFAVNAGSDELSVFRRDGADLDLTDVVDSGGAQPVSVTVDRRRVFVLNAGRDGSITGFELSKRGTLSRLSRSAQPLDIANADPFQVQFTPDGRQLVVTIKSGPAISVYPVDREGRLGDPDTHASTGSDPTGFAFLSIGKREALMVAESFTGPTRGGGISSYRLEREAALSPIDFETVGGFNCWVAFEATNRIAYSSSPDGDVITGFIVGRDGALSLLDDDGVAVATPPGSKPTDLALDRKGRFLYVLLPGSRGIGAYAIQTNGSLVGIPTDISLPADAAGLAAF